MDKTIIYNAEIVNDMKCYRGYVVIDSDLIAETGAGDPHKDTFNSCTSKIDARGAMLIPGVIDDQVHFRDPGLTHKADIETESRAAVAGGVTSFMDMPNTNPPTTTLEALEAKYQRAAECSHANYSFFVGATNDNLDTLKSIDYTATCGVKLFLGSSTGNMLVDNTDTIAKIFSEVPAIIAIHSEDESIINHNKQLYIEKYGDNLPVEYHPMIRSEEACYACTSRAVGLARQYGTRLHVLHLSTARELSLFDNTLPIEEKKITAEVCAHHLWFSDEDYAEKGNRIKCNPAVKTKSDREALRRGLNENLIDIVATDHAPHLLSEKEGNCLKAASGMPLVQFSLITMLEMAHQGVFSVEKVVEKMCHAPALLYRIERRGFIRPGYYADLALVDTNCEHTLSADDVVSRCGWSPLEGTKFHNKVIATWVNGKQVYDNGRIVDVKAAQRLTFKN